MIAEPIILSSSSELGRSAGGSGITCCFCLSPQEILDQRESLVAHFFRSGKSAALCVDLTSAAVPVSGISVEVLELLTLLTYSTAYLYNRQMPVIAILCSHEPDQSALASALSTRILETLRAQGQENCIVHVLREGVSLVQGSEPYFYLADQTPGTDSGILVNLFTKLLAGNFQPGAPLFIRSPSWNDSLTLLNLLTCAEKEFALANPVTYSHYRDLLELKNANALLESQNFSYRSKLVGLTSSSNILRKESLEIIDWYKAEIVKIQEWYRLEYETLPVWYKYFGKVVRKLAGGRKR